MAGKRIEKKRLKKSLGYKDKEPIKQSELKAAAEKQAQKNKRANQQAARYNKNIQYLRDKNIPTDIITRSTSTKETIQRADQYLKEKRKQRRIELFNEKIKYLVEHGRTEEEARKIVGSPSHQKSWKDITEKEIIADVWLYVGFADLYGDGFFKYDYDPDESRTQIDERLTEAKTAIDDSGNNFRGIFIVEYGTEEEMEHMAWTYYQRSMRFAADHIKFDGKQYHKITVSNKWTEREFLNLVNSVLAQARNADVFGLYQKFKAYDSKAKLGFL